MGDLRGRMLGCSESPFSYHRSRCGYVEAVVKSGAVG